MMFESVPVIGSGKKRSEVWIALRPHLLEEESKDDLCKVISRASARSGMGCGDKSYLKGVERTPGQEDRDAGRSERSVAPERIRDQSRFAQLLLSADPDDEDWDERDRYGKRGNGGGLAIVRGTASDGGQSIGQQCE